MSQSPHLKTLYLFQPQALYLNLFLLFSLLLLLGLLLLLLVLVEDLPWFLQFPSLVLIPPLICSLQHKGRYCAYLKGFTMLLNICLITYVIRFIQLFSLIPFSSITFIFFFCFIPREPSPNQFHLPNTRA